MKLPLAGDEERFVLLAMHQTLVERGLYLRQPTAKGMSPADWRAKDNRCGPRRGPTAAV